MWLRVYHVRVPEVDPMIKYLTMFRDGATLAIEIAHIVLVLAHAFGKRFSFTDVGGGALCTRYLIDHALCFLFWEAIFRPWHEPS